MSILAINTYVDSILLSKFLFRVVRRPRFIWGVKRNLAAIFFKPHMRLQEYFLFKSLCRRKKVIVEYGSGGSTIHFLRHKKRVYTVESDPQFYRFMCSTPQVKKALGRNLSIHFVNLGPTTKWGVPVHTDNQDTWPEYYTSVWKEVQDHADEVDLVFIDGRFRVSCCLYSILKVMENGYRDTLFIIHDFWNNKKYQALLQFLDEYRSAATLGAFTIKKGVAPADVESMLQEYALVTA